jgi:hypothetical protein
MNIAASRIPKGPLFLERPPMQSVMEASRKQSATIHAQEHKTAAQQPPRIRQITAAMSHQ